MSWDVNGKGGAVLEVYDNKERVIKKVTDECTTTNHYSDADSFSDRIIGKLNSINDMLNRPLTIEKS